MNVRYVTKRKGFKEEVNVDKINKRLKYLISEPTVLKNVDCFKLIQHTVQQINDNIETSKIDTYMSNLSASLGTVHIDYLTLAGRIAINNHHKNTLESFSDKMEILYMRKDIHGKICPLLNNEFYKFVKKNKKQIDKYIDYDRDYYIDYFGFKTLERGYLLKVNEKIVERPQDLFMRVAIQLYIPEELKKYKDPSVMDKIKKVYNRISQKYYVHATPTLFNTGTVQGSYSSCFLLGTEDSRKGIMKTLDDCSEISKKAGGIGVHVSNIRGKGSIIRGTNGKSSGLVPFLRLFNDNARAFNQGGKRLGSFAIYIEPHHPDILEFLDLRKNVGDENMRCRDLFLAVWVNDLFMERVRSDSLWSLFCPDQCPKLNECYGEEYKKLYLKYEESNLYVRQIKAREIFNSIMDSVKESGIPYVCHKDAVNRCNMQSNIGIIKSSNLCSEITIYSDSKQYGTCNLASICLPKYVEDTWSQEELKQSEKRELNHDFPLHPKFNFKLLAEVAGELTENLNQVIDKNYNPTVECVRSNFNHRPIGIGVQGLADVFLKFRIPFESDEAKDLNKKIFEAIYYGALTRSTELAKEKYLEIYHYLDEKTDCEKKQKEYKYYLYPKKVLNDIINNSYMETIENLQSPYIELSEKDKQSIKNKIAGIYKKESELDCFTNIEDIPKTIGAYPSYLLNEGSHISKGTFHWELFGLTEDDLSGLFDWESLQMHIKIYGVRNSLLCAAMPTASTSQIMGCSQGFEPYVSNIYKRKTNAGEYVVINKYLMKDLQDTGLWTNKIKNYIMLNNGSIQNIDGIPNNFKQLYKTAWEIKQKNIIEMGRDRQAFIDQSQSMNLFVEELDIRKFTALQFYSWRCGLKTGSYYIRTRPAMVAQKFTISPEIQKEFELQQLLKEQEKNKTLIDDEEEICLMCSS